MTTNHSLASSEDLTKPIEPQPAKAPNVATNGADSAGQADDGEKKFDLKSVKFWSIILGVFSSVFLVALDRIILATAIPAITDQFDSIKDIGWYGSGYMLTLAIFLPLFGRVYKIYSIKWVFLESLVIFEAGSTLSAAAPSSVAFIIGRAIAGIGSAGIFNGGMNITVGLVPLHKRPAFTSMFGMFTALASILGPLLGGAFTDSPSLTWRWCFYINLPIGGATFVAVLFFLKLEAQPRKKLTIYEQFLQLDPLGVLFLAPSMICLVLALQYGAEDSWSSPRVIGLLVTFAVTLIIFAAVEVLLPDTAMLPTRIILQRSMIGSTWYMFLLSGAFSVVVYYLAIWFQAADGASAKEAGIRTIPLLLSFVIMGILAGIFTQKLGYYIPALYLGPILLSIGSGLLSTLTPSASLGKWFGYQVIFGFGLGAGFQTSMLVPQTVLGRSDVPLGMAAQFFFKELGGAIFFAVAQNIFSTQLLSQLSGTAGLDTQAILNTGATNLRKVVPANEISKVVNAYSYALTRDFVMAAALSAACILGCLALEWKSIKKPKVPTADVEKAGPMKSVEEKAEATTVA